MCEAMTRDGDRPNFFTASGGEEFVIPGHDNPRAISTELGNFLTALPISQGSAICLKEACQGSTFAAKAVCLSRDRLGHASPGRQTSQSRCGCDEFTGGVCHPRGLVPFAIGQSYTTGGTGHSENTQPLNALGAISRV